MFYSDSDINSAFDELARSEVEPGYSTYALESRQELLDIARHDLIANKSSRGAGGQPRPRELSIPADLASGVLALLAEVCVTRVPGPAGSLMLCQMEEQFWKQFAESMFEWMYKSL